MSGDVDSILLHITSIFRDTLLFGLLLERSLVLLITLIIVDIFWFQLIVDNLILLKFEDQTFKIWEDFVPSRTYSHSIVSAVDLHLGHFGLILEGQSLLTILVEVEDPRALFLVR